MPAKLAISTALAVGLAIVTLARPAGPTSANLQLNSVGQTFVGPSLIGLQAFSACPAASGATHPTLSGPLVISAPGLYDGDGQTVIGGNNNIDIEASNVTVCNYTLQGAQGASVNIGSNGSFSHVTLSALNIQDYNQSGAGGNAPGGPQYVGGIACWYCTGLTVVNSTIASTKDYGDGIWVKRTNAAEAGPDYLAGNTIIGGWDGIGSEPEGDPDGGFGSGTVIENNSVSGCHDDGIQLDGRDENITARNNTITGCGTGFSTAPALMGPVHIENNYIHDLAYAPSRAFFCFKLGASQGTMPAEIDYTNNVCLGGSATDPGGLGPGGWEQTNTGLNFKIIARGNCVQDGQYVIEFSDTPGSGTLFDYNKYYTSDPNRFAKWGGNQYSLAGLQGTGQDLHSSVQQCSTPSPPPGSTNAPVPTPTPSRATSSTPTTRARVPAAASIRADIDCDGTITPLDSLRILQIVAMGSYSGSCTSIADVNCDGTISAVDALLVLLAVVRGDALNLTGCPIEISAAVPTLADLRATPLTR